MVRMKGLEPPHISTLEPKSSASTNFATSAYRSTLFSPLGPSTWDGRDRMLLYGAGCRIRTGHLLITSQLLYQMS